MPSGVAFTFTVSREGISFSRSPVTLTVSRDGMSSRLPVTLTVSRDGVSSRRPVTLTVPRDGVMFGFTFIPVVFLPE